MGDPIKVARLEYHNVVSSDARLVVNPGCSPPHTRESQYHVNVGAVSLN